MADMICGLVIYMIWQLHTTTQNMALSESADITATSHLCTEAVYTCLSYVTNCMGKKIRKAIFNEYAQHQIIISV